MGKQKKKSANLEQETCSETPIQHENGLPMFQGSSQLGDDSCDQTDAIDVGRNGTSAELKSSGGPDTDKPLTKSAKRKLKLQKKNLLPSNPGKLTLDSNGEVEGHPIEKPTKKKGNNKRKVDTDNAASLDQSSNDEKISETANDAVSGVKKQKLQTDHNSKQVKSNSNNKEDNSVTDKAIKTIDANAKQKKNRYVVFVGRLPPNTAETDLRNHFAKAGKINSIRIPLQKGTSVKRNIAFVEFDDKVAYENAIMMNHTMLNNQQINVQYTGQNLASNGQQKETKAKQLKLKALCENGKMGNVAKKRLKNINRRLRRQKALAGLKNNEADV